MILYVKNINTNSHKVPYFGGSLNDSWWSTLPGFPVLNQGHVGFQFKFRDIKLIVETIIKIQPI